VRYKLKETMKNFIIIVILFAGILSSAYILQNQPENKSKQANELLYFPSGTFIREVSLDYKTTMTNLMWLQVVQYYGQHLMTDKDLHQLYNLFNIITDLDPYFKQCYVFGGTIITYDQKRPDLGLNLLKKGMANLPDSWEIPFITGFIYYIYEKDYFAAYKWFEFASYKPDAPDYCKKFAASAMKRKGDFITALRLWTQIYENSNNRMEKENVVANIIYLIEMDFNSILKEKGLEKTSIYINQQIKDLTFLPFSVKVKVLTDTVIVEQK